MYNDNNSIYGEYFWYCDKCIEFFKPYGEIDYISRTDEHLCPICGNDLICIGYRTDEEIEEIINN